MTVFKTAWEITGIILELTNIVWLVIFRHEFGPTFQNFAVLVVTADNNFTKGNH